MKIKERNVVVNGGAGGIGQGLIKRMLLEGAANVACVDLSPNAIEFAAEMNKLFAEERVIPYVGDATNQEFIQNTMEDFINRTGRVPEILVNLMGAPLDSLTENYKPGAPIKVKTVEQIQKNLLINAAAPAAWACVFAYYHDKKRQEEGLGNWADEGGFEEGVVVFTGSVSATAGITGQLGYGMGKNALVGAVNVFKTECYERLGLRPVLINPGFIETPMVTGMKQGIREAVKQQIPCKQFMQVHEIVDIFIFAIECKSNSSAIGVGNGYTCPPRLYAEGQKKVA